MSNESNVSFDENMQENIKNSKSVTTSVNKKSVKNIFPPNVSSLSSALAINLVKVEI